MLNDEKNRDEVSQETREKLNKYLSSDLDYFGVQIYHNDELELLFMAMNEYYRLLSMEYFIVKKKLLDYQADLLNNK